jgi:hypothetical protein
MVGDIAQAAGEILPHELLVVIGRIGPEQRAETLVQLGVGEAQPLLQLVTFDRVGTRRETTRGLAVGDVLDDRRAFGQAQAIVEFEHRHVTLAVDRREVTAVGQLALADINANEFEVEPGLAQRNVWRQRAGSRGEVEFHVVAPLWWDGVPAVDRLCSADYRAFWHDRKGRGTIAANGFARAAFAATIVVMDTSPPLAGTRAAWLLAGVELFFSLSWVVYVIFLPDLLARGGVDKRYLPWLLAADQLLFALADWSVGVAVDRARAALRRIGPLLVLLSAVSAVAMLLLPWLAGRRSCSCR